MAGFFRTYNDVDSHIDILVYLHSKNGYIPIFYQMAVINSLSVAIPGLVMYFFAELNKRNKQLMIDYFGSPVDLGLPEKPKVTINRISELTKML